MEQAIATNEGNDERTYVFLALNLLGVLGCLCLLIILTLWGLGLIFPESETEHSIWIYINQMRNLSFKPALYLSLDPLKSSAPDYPSIVRNVFNMSLMTIAVSVVLVVAFAIFTKIY